MEQSVTLNIYEIVGSEFCVSADDGQKVFEQISLALHDGHPVQISFNNIKRLTSAFLNVAIGQLYGSFESSFLTDHLSVIDMDPSDRYLLLRVIETSKSYFKDPKRFEQIRTEVLGEKEDAGK